MPCSIWIHRGAAGGSQLCSALTESNPDIWDNENAVQHLSEMCMIMCCHSEVVGRGESERDSCLVKGDVVTSGLCWLKIFLKERRGINQRKNRPRRGSRCDIPNFLSHHCFCLLVMCRITVGSELGQGWGRGESRAWLGFASSKARGSRSPWKAIPDFLGVCLSRCSGLAARPLQRLPNQGGVIKTRLLYD